MAEKEQFDLEDNDNLYDSYVESSGRYMASLSTYESFTLFSVWDLGLSGRDVIMPLARYPETAQVRLRLDAFYADPHGSNCFFLVSTHESSLLSPVSISFQSEISFLAKIQIPISSPFIIPRIARIKESGLLVVDYEDDEDTRHIWIWDFQSDMAAAFIPLHYTPTGRDTTVFSRDCVMITSPLDGCIRVYNIPPLLPRQSLTDAIGREPEIIVAAPWRAPESFYVAHRVAEDLCPYFFGLTPSQAVLFKVTNNGMSQNLAIPNQLPIVVRSLRLTDPLLWNQRQRVTCLQQFENHLLLPVYGTTLPADPNL
ncbi:hypothetical protein CVT26_008713 [Gymnopilus dilepis]|uniref:Uncharacterized protein n=1 Tax=Gymnopilus dilepis TaxID=231916 RepID=A0A409YG87_9AGAR|nr:hypothetical protein CVT26_008713 [Gymnopilus dilepis]